MTITELQHTFYEGFISMQNKIQDASSKPIETVKQVALPIIKTLGEMGAYGISSISHTYKIGVENLSKMVSLINSWVNRLFFQTKEVSPQEVLEVATPEIEIVVIKEEPVVLDPPIQEIIELPILAIPEANIISDTVDPVLQMEELLNQVTLTKTERAQLKAEVQLGVETLLKEINEIVLKYHPTESEKEEFLANLKVELNTISDRINFDIDPVTQGLEEFIAPKEMVFAQAKLMLITILKTTTEFVQEHAPTEEEKAAILAKIKAEGTIILERMMTNAKLSEEFSVEKIYAGDREEALKVLNHVDSRNMY